MHATLESPSLEFRDRQASEDLRDMRPDACLILDIGAGDGFWAREARAMWPSARIVSFEPACRFRQSLKQIDDRHSILRQCVGAHAGHAKLYMTRGPESNSTLEFLPDGPLATLHSVSGHEEVEQVRLDDLTLNRVDILKIDVQGAELQVLDGARGLIERDNPIIYCEVQFQQLYKDAPLLADVDEYMDGIGYRRFALYESPMRDLWGDAIYVHDMSWSRVNDCIFKQLSDKLTDPIRLNIGAGDVVIPGFTAIDRKLGTEAYPLDYPDNSVEEIRCVHMLEHLSFAEVLDAMKEWRRVLRPGGRLRISVPDIRKISSMQDSRWAYFLMGGQMDADDFHKSAYDEARLREYFRTFGFDNIQHWTSQNTDLAACDEISLNIEGFKGAMPAEETTQNVKLRAVMGLPRVGWNDAWLSITEMLHAFNIPIETQTGCFWGQNLTKGMQRAIDDGIDWLLTLDYDSMVLPCHLERLIQILSQRPDIDAIAALQMRRGAETPLFGITGKLEADITPDPIEVHTAHFGLTLIRVKCLTDMQKPWLHAIPDENGEWGDNRRDDDITFWDRWRAAGHSIYVAPDVRIGHLELVVSEYDENFKPVHRHIGEWWNHHARAGHCTRSRKEI